MNTHSRLLLHSVSVLVLAVTLLLTAIPAIRAETHSTDVTLSVTPNPAGVNQPVNIAGTVSPAPPDGYYYIDIEFEITRPDGIVEILGPYTSDSNGTASTDFVPTQCGTYTVFYKSREQNITGDLYLDSEPTTLEFTVHLTAPDNDDDNMEPVAHFTFSPASPEINETVNFDASASIDPDGSITDYFWDFGDGTTGTGITATHSYLSKGNYTVFLTVTDNNGLTDNTSRTIHEVIPEFPTTLILPLLATAVFFMIYRKRLPDHLQEAYLETNHSALLKSVFFLKFRDKQLNVFVESFSCLFAGPAFLHVLFE